MQINYKSEGSNELFYIEEEGKQIGEIVFTITGDNLIITHTEVDDAYRNNDVGQALVERTVEYAREKNFKVVAQCPFARAVIEKTESLQDILA